jgi:flagellar biosynthesis/type III secretory pathway ATPase
MRKMISDGAGSAQINPTAKNTALELLAGPLAASTLAEYMERRATKVLLTL